MATGQGVISGNDLMNRLVMAKKVMDKVETGTYETGNVNEAAIRNAQNQSINTNSSISLPDLPTNKSNGMVNVDKINNSKLPDAIKRAMIENPISQITLSDGLDMNILKGAKRLMEQEGVSKKQTPIQHTSSNIDMNAISVLIENTIRKVLDEKLNQLLTAQQTTSINESLVLKVGDSIFKGKITGVNKAK